MSLSPRRQSLLALLALAAANAAGMTLLSSDLVAGLLLVVLAVPGSLLARRALHGQGPWPLLGRLRRDNRPAHHRVQLGPAGATRSYRERTAERVSFQDVERVLWVRVAESPTEPACWMLLCGPESQLCVPVGAGGQASLLDTVRSWAGFDPSALLSARSAALGEVWCLWARSGAVPAEGPVDR